MSYVSLLYLLVFLPVVLLLYKISPRRLRWTWLLLASYFFFFLWSRKLLLYLLVSTVSAHYLGLWMDACRNAAQDPDGKPALAKKLRGILWLGIFTQIGTLLFLKYFNFFSANANTALGLLSIPFKLPTYKLAVPLGISFYTLQAMSYVADVYYGKLEADRNLGRLALYMAFFPIIMEGPICRYSQTAQDLYAGKPVEWKNLTFGCQRIVWGVFKKAVIADRLAVLVKTVFGQHAQYSGIVVVLAAVCYTFQLYMDFSGCIDITIGTGEIFGVTIPENFRQPFFSKSASEFWRRWHITLGTWFKDYIFYPLSLTRAVKKIGKKTRHALGRHAGQMAQIFLPLFAVWIANGVWHGTGWSYLFYGMYYFVLIFLGDLCEPLVEKVTAFLHIRRTSGGYRVFQSVKLLLIVFTGELFFRADGLRAGLSMFKSIFTGFKLSALTDGSLLSLGLTWKDFLVTAVGLLLVLAVSILREKGVSLREKIAALRLPYRWGIWYALLLLTVIFAAYGTGYVAVDPLYAGF